MERRVRVATTDDAAAIREIYAPFVESTPITFEVEPPTTEEMAGRIESTLETRPWVVCETATGEILGYAAASALRSKRAFQWAVELSIYVAEDAQRDGVGSALYSSLLEILTEQGFYDAYVAITLPNEASVRLHERLGFEPVGTFPSVGNKHEAWHDVQWWQRQLAERPPDPAPPTPLPEIRDTPPFERALDAGERHFEP